MLTKDKDIAKHVIDTLPQDAIMDDIIHASYVKTKFDHSESEVREGKEILHEEAKHRLLERLVK